MLHSSWSSSYSLLVISEGVLLNIVWSHPKEPNGVITTYEVCSNISGVFSYTNTSATQHTLRDLPPNTVVTFSVRAYTIIGPGEYVTGQTTTGLSASEYQMHLQFLFNYNNS